MERTMLACYYEKFGGPEVDKVGQIRKPEESDLKDNQVLIRVHAASLNPADYKQRKGDMKLILSYEFPQVYGFDFSGVVIASKCDKHNVGDQVFGMCKGLRRGSLAEFMVVDGDIAVAKPESISHQEAASVPLVGITSVLAFRKCGLKENSSTKPRVLVTGGSGGVGSVAIQLAKGLYGASFVATTASGAKADFVRSIGADKVVDYKTEDFAQALASEDEAQLFDAILDCTGEAKKCPHLLKHGGGLVSIMSSPTSLCLQEFLAQSETASFQKITIGVESFLSSKFGGAVFDRITGAKSLRSQCEKRGGTFAHIIGTGSGEIMEILAEEMVGGRLKACIDKVYPLKDALQAVKHIESGRSTGKVVVSCLSTDAADQ